MRIINAGQVNELQGEIMGGGDEEECAYELCERWLR